MSNVNQIKAKAAKITLLDGVEHTLRYTLNAMAELEDEYGTVTKAFEALDNGSIKAVRFVLWAGLLHENEAITVQQVGNLIDIELMSNLQDTMGQAFEASMPDTPLIPATEQLQDPNV